MKFLNGLLSSTDIAVTHEALVLSGSIEVQ